jgi:hypothetical protein
MKYLSNYVVLILMTLFSLTLFSITLFPGTSFSEGRDANYSIWESYGAAYNHTLNYPDFSLRFIEKKPGQFYPGSTTHRLSDVYVFNIKKGENVQTVNWSAGTGAIGPIEFTVDGQKYLLEMLKSELVNESVPDYKVLVWQEPEFQRRLTLNH